MVALPDPIGFTACHPAIGFLDSFFGAEPWPLIAIRDGSAVAMTQTQAERRATAAQEWIARHNRDRYAVYFGPNPLRAALVKKASKADIAAARWLWADV